MNVRARLLLSMVCPPAIVATCAGPSHVLISVVLTASGWLPGVVHAMIVVLRCADEHDPAGLARCLCDPDAR